MNTKQRLFADSYIRLDRNGTRAALDAGYSPATARSQACHLLALPEVSKYVERELNKVYKRNHLNIDEAISILVDIGRTTKQDLLDEEGNFIPIHLLPKSVAHAIEEVEYSTVHIWDEMMEQRVPRQVIKKIKLAGKQAALDKALKHLGGYSVDNLQKRPDPIILNINPLAMQNTTLDVQQQPIQLDE
jgi:phage terminase small subunit